MSLLLYRHKLLSNIQWKASLLNGLTLAGFLSQLLWTGLDNLVIASPQPKLGIQLQDNNQIKPIIIPGNHRFEKNSSLSQSLEMINQMDDSEMKVILLNDLALFYANLGEHKQAMAILQQSLLIANSFDELRLKVTTITNIARYYHQIGEQSKAIEILSNTEEIVQEVGDKSLQAQLLLDISFKYREIGKEETAENLFSQSQTLMIEASQPLPKFPFRETASSLGLGFAGTLNSFRDTTFLIGVNVDYYKQWVEEDIYIDADIYLNYDSNRSFNNYRPSSLIKIVYRHHFDDQWSFFTEIFNSTNQDLYASKNDDEDLVIITNLIVGAGLNLWRGESPSEFLDLQLGFGSRYEYDYINFERKQNNIDPTLALILSGRNIALGNSTLNQVLAIIPSLNNFNNYIISSNTQLSIPFNQKWSFINNLFLRYRNEVIYEKNPQLEVLFSTGLEYNF